jgi:hypothetical protein
MTPTRAEVLKALAEMSELHPEWRIGQLVANVSHWARGATVESIWDVEDEEFLDAVRRHIEKRTASTHSAAST